ncbi:MAG: PAS domain S-box protein [Candidatus Acidiferrales bacterium]
MTPTETIEKPQERASLEWERLERAEHNLWRNSIFLLLALAVGLAAGSWSTLHMAPPWSNALPAGLVILVVLFGIYVWRRKSEINELRGLLRGLHEASSHPPTGAQVDKLLEVISSSQRGYRDLIDSLDHAVFTLSPDGKLRVANRYMSQMIGVPFVELIGHRLDEFFAEPSRADAEQAFAHLLERGNWDGRISLRLKKSGELRYFDSRFQTVHSEGKVVAVSGWAHDVTAQHQSEIRFTELFEALREGIFFTTPDGQLLDANPALVRMLGYDSKEELQKHNFRDLYVDPSHRDQLIREMGETGSLQDREILFRRKDGKQIHCLGSGFAIHDMFGKFVRAQGTLVDVTERLEIEKRLHREQEFVRRLVASFPDIIAVLDGEARFTFVSQRIQDVLGGPPKDYIGQTLGARSHPEDQSKLTEMFESVMTGRDDCAQTEFRTRHADGSWRTLRASSAPLFDEAGKISGVVTSARDVTESNQTEQQMMQKEKLAAMGQMMAGVAHELNNPLTAILGVSDLLRERATDDTTRRQVEIVLQQARRAAGIIQNLLSFSRPATLGRAKVRLDAIVQGALQLQHASLEKKNIKVEFASPADLPAIDGDAKLLTQVFTNLIANAEQAISAARDHGTLRISISNTDGKVSATFADDGPGITPENTSRIFDPFFTTKRPGGGTGLGLTISLALAREHGGTIEVQSTPGSGATFRVVLPVAVGEMPPEPRSLRDISPAVADSAAVQSSALRGHSVLVVDDEDSIREIVQEGLAARGMIVDGVSSSEEALTQLEGASYEVVLCDFNLPGLNGDELFERLRSKAGSSAPRFVFMTGDLLDPSTISAIVERGAWVLQKPFHVSALASLLTELLQPQPVKL